MNLYFFGADDTWTNILEKGFNRRNTNFLKAFSESPRIRKTYNVHRIPKDKWFKAVFKTKRHNIVNDIYYCSLLPDKYGKGFNKIIAKLQIILQIGKLPKDKDIIWCYWPRGYENANYINFKGRWFFDTDHNIIDDPNLEPSQYAGRKRILKEVSGNSKIEGIVSSSRGMLEWFGCTDKKTIRIRNGIELNRFHSSKKQTKHSPNPTPIIGYCGTLSRWIKWGWLYQLIEELPDFNFQFIGTPYKNENYKHLSQYKNVRLIGYVNSQQLPSYLKKFDAALGLYQKHPALDVDSMKLYEYLAAELPVFTNDFHPFLKEDFDNNLIIATNFQSLKNNIKNLSNFQLNLEQKEKTRKFLEKSTWKSRVKEFFKTID